MIKDKMLRLGKTICDDMHSAASSDILAGPEGTYATDSTVTAPLERWSAALALRLIMCDSLALRVKGASDLRELVEQVRTRCSHFLAFFGMSSLARVCGFQVTESTSELPATTRRGLGGGFVWSSQYATQVYAPPVIRWFDPRKLSAFFRDHGVLDVLLGVPATSSDSQPVPPVHLQTLSRVPVILKFLTQVRLRIQVMRGCLCFSNQTLMPTALQHGGEPPAPGNPFIDTVASGTSASEPLESSLSTSSRGYVGCVSERHIDALFSLLVDQVCKMTLQRVLSPIEC